MQNENTTAIKISRSERQGDKKIYLADVVRSFEASSPAQIRLQKIDTQLTKQKNCKNKAYLSQMSEANTFLIHERH